MNCGKLCVKGTEEMKWKELSGKYFVKDKGIGGKMLFFPSFLLTNFIG